MVRSIRESLPEPFQLLCRSLASLAAGPQAMEHDCGNRRYFDGQACSDGSSINLDLWPDVALLMPKGFFRP